VEAIKRNAIQIYGIILTEVSRNGINAKNLKRIFWMIITSNQILKIDNGNMNKANKLRKMLK
jgi:hypothetical protein